MYLTEDIIKIKFIDKERYINFKKKKILLDNWAKYSFHDFLMEDSKRSKNASFYTPEWIVRLMVRNSLKILKSKLINIENIKILEPSCGSGNFLQVIIEELHNETGKSYEKIIKENIYCIDVDFQALEVSKKRIKDIFGFELQNFYCCDALLFDMKGFDLIIGNPPYGNLLDKELKIKLKDKYGNIALNFINHFYKLLTNNGLLYFIVPHSFSRAGQGALAWRKEIIENQSLYEIIDVGNPFFDITLEQIIIGLTKVKNEIVNTNSIRYNKIGNKVSYKEIFDNDEKIILIYYDDVYKKIKNSLPMYPFNGKRGKDFNKKELLNDNGKFWIILGKNITKNGLININGYDKYSNDEKCSLIDDCVAITQFGINLKATLVPKGCILSGGVVLISHKDMTKEEAISYLNKSSVNEYLKKYILNGAELTVHLDGKYLKQIPFTNLLD